MGSVGPHKDAVDIELDARSDVGSVVRAASMPVKAVGVEIAVILRFFERYESLLAFVVLYAVICTVVLRRVKKDKR